MFLFLRKYLFVAFVCCVNFLLAQNDSIEKKEPIITLRGYVKDMQTASFGNNLNNITSDNLIHNRLNFRINPVKSIVAALEFRNRLFWGESVDAVADYGKLVDIDNGIVDMSWLVFNESSAVLLTQLDRAWISWNNDKWDVRAGRQRINWGVNLFWNSNDLFNVYSLVDFDYEERPGSDAIRVQWFFKNMKSIDVAVKPGKNEDDWIAAAMYKFNKKKYDFQLLAGWWNTDIAIGGGWAGNIKNGGFKGEVTYFHPQKKLTDTLGIVSASISYDNVLPHEIFISTGVLFNSRGIDTSLNVALNLFALPISAKSLMPMKYSFLLNVSHSFSPVINASLVAIYSPVIDVTFFMPSVSYSVANNWELAFFAQSFWMDTGKYANLANGVFLRLKGSF